MTSSPLLGNTFLRDYLSDDSGAGASTDGHLELGEAKPLDGDDLSRNIFTIYENSVVVDDVDNDGEATLLPTVVNFGDTAHFDELGEGLYEVIFTIRAN
jgi:hypothetical protein